MITLLIVSVMMAAMAPIMSKKASTSSNIAASSVPPGVIAMWSGNINNIPRDWALCDGRNGTPNLSGKFIVGYDTTDTDYDEIGKPGGEKTHTLTVDEMPEHNHISWFKGKIDYNPFGTINYPDSTTDADQGSDTCCIRRLNLTSKTGGSQAHENRPPYYVLAYIMKK